MSDYGAHPPELIPILSRGKHRSPRKGACFMELVSYLAGERWSDHPACTHPLLAAVARDVNDYISDAGRARLAGLIPSVIGLTGEDLHIDARIALVCARRALPVAAAGRQQTMAVSVLACERVLAGLDGHPAGWLEEQSRQALAQAPDAAHWARRFTRDLPISPKAFRRQAAPATVRAAVQGIALACVPQPDEMLHALLIDTIDACGRWAAGTPAVAHRATARHGRPARALTGTAAAHRLHAPAGRASADNGWSPGPAVCADRGVARARAGGTSGRLHTGHDEQLLAAAEATAAVTGGIPGPARTATRPST
jgi:hypothetical protein